MDAILLVGGEGTRLRPLTCHTPKPMLPIAGRPITEIQIARLAAAGITRIALATAYKAEVFATHFGTSHDGVELHYAVEDTPLGTGGAIRNAADLLTGGHPDDPIIIFNGDILGDHDLTAQLQTHLDANADITLHLVRVPDPRAFGVVPTTDDHRVTAFLEKTPEPPTNQINAGCYIFRRRVITDLIEAGTVTSVEKQTFPTALDRGYTVIGHSDDSYWLDLGTPAAYAQGSADLVTGTFRSPLPADGTVHNHAVIHHTAMVHPSAMITAGSYIGAGARIAANVLIEGTAVLPDTAIGPDSVIRNSIIGRAADLGESTVLTDAVVGDKARLGAHNAFPSGVRIWADASIPTGVVRLDGSNPAR